MNFPEKLKYTREHEWLRIEGKEAVIGITAYAQKELGDIVYVELDVEGEELSAGDRFGTIEAVKTSTDLFMPVSATILEINTALESSPELINKDPYGDGWMVKVELTDLAELDSLISAKVYEEIVKE